MSKTSKKILIIDDDPSSSALLKEIVRMQWDAATAQSGKRGIEMAYSEQPDLILLDVMMADIDGYEVCRQLKENPRTRQIPVIYVTGQEDPEGEIKGLAAGADDYVKKPFSPAIVVARIRNHLDLKSYRNLVENMVQLDAQTGVPNHDRFAHTLGREWRRASLLKHSLAMLLVDIDNFSAFNQEHGHRAGNDCLSLVASCIEATLRRPSDVVARWGSDKFACLLPDTDQESALAVAAQIQAAVSAIQVPIMRSETAGTITVSLGVAAVVPNEGGDPSELERRAFKAVAQAGRAQASSE